MGRRGGHNEETKVKPAALFSSAEMCGHATLAEQAWTDTEGTPTSFSDYLGLKRCFYNYRSFRYKGDLNIDPNTGFPAFWEPRDTGNP